MIWALLRILIGILFIVSGLEKIINPYQNFLYVIENYELLPVSLAEVVARVFPWVEFITGIFMLLGFWLKQALTATLILFGIFITVVLQAIVRKLPVVDCGCFGGLIHLNLQTVFLMDTCLLIITSLLVYNIGKTRSLSLDKLFDN